MSNAVRPAMVFAAGHGRRMGALSRHTPKPLLRVGGQTLLDHALGWVRGAGAAPVVVNCHHLSGRIAAHLAGSGVRLSAEADDLLDTGGGLRAALPMLGDGPVFTINADALWTGPNPLVALEAGWRRDRLGAPATPATPGALEGLVLLVPRQRARAHAGRGDFALDGAGRISRGRDFVYTGAQILRTERLAAIPERAFSLNRIWDEMIAAGRLGGVVYDGDWCDVGTVHGLREARRMSGRANV